MQLDFQMLSWIKLRSVRIRFLIILSLNVLVIKMQAWPDTELSKSTSDNLILPNNYSGNCSYLNCNITCVNGASKYLPTDIKAGQPCQISIISLTIFNYTFENMEIQKNWLPASQQIFELQIVSSIIAIIQPDAFASEPFRTLTALILKNLKLTTLGSNVFRGLDNLIQLIITQDIYVLSNIVNDVLVPMQFKIKTLQINGNMLTPKHLTSGLASLSSLTDVDLSYNGFRNELDSTTFCKLKVVESLDLSHSRIMSLLSDVFRDIGRTIRILNLSNNWLTTLPPFIFQPLLSTYVVIVDLSVNNWNCTCNLQKAVAQLMTTPIAVCSNPPELAHVLIAGSDICDYEEAIRIDSGASNSQATTPASSNQSQIIDVMCQICNLSDCSNDQSSYFERLPIHGGEEIKITLLTRTSVQVAVAKTDGLDYGLIWFSNGTKFYYQMQSNYKEHGLGCYGSVMKPVIVDNLVPNKTYTFCLVRLSEALTSPFNCVSQHMSVRVQNVWLLSEKKTAVISMLICVNLISLLLGMSLVYCIVMKNPTLLRGSKRVVVVKKNSVDNSTKVPRTDSVIRVMKRVEAATVEKNRLCLMEQTSDNSPDCAINYISSDLYETIPADKFKEVEKPYEFYHPKPIVPKRLSDDPLPLPPLGQNIENICHNFYY